MHMPDAEHCLVMADEADRLTAIVSYGRDKTRLKEQAASWREKAVEAEHAARKSAATEVVKVPSSVMDWLRRRRA